MSLVVRWPNQLCVREAVFCAVQSACVCVVSVCVCFVLLFCFCLSLSRSDLITAQIASFFSFFWSSVFSIRSI